VNVLLALPIVVPMAAAAVSLAFRRSPKVQYAAGAVSSAAGLAVAVGIFFNVSREGILKLEIGNWPAPFGIVLVADLFSAIMLLVSTVIAAAVFVYSTASTDEERRSLGFYPLLQVLLMGVYGAFMTGDLFNLYVWFEVMLMASFVLLSLGGGRAQIEGAIKYLALNLISSAFFLAATAVLYGITGTVNFAELARQLDGQSGSVTVVAMLFLVAFSIKAAAFPFFFWLPASYHTPPVAVSAVFAGLLTKVGVYALVRVFTLLFVGDTAFTHGIILWMAAFTMIVGVLGAVSQNDARRVLSFHIVSQIGYMLMGLGIFTPAALAGCVFYIFHHMLVKTNLFLVAGIAEKTLGTFELKKMGGLYASSPLLAGLFLVSALSLAGLPPLSGFFAKLILIKSGIEAGAGWVSAVALIVGLLTLFSMTKIWNEAFWKPLPASSGATNGGRPAFAWIAPVALLAACTVAIGLAAGPAYDLSLRTATQLMDRGAYVQAVLGDGS